MTPTDRGRRTYARRVQASYTQAFAVELRFLISKLHISILYILVDRERREVILIRIEGMVGAELLARFMLVA